MCSCCSFACCWLCGDSTKNSLHPVGGGENPFGYQPVTCWLEQLVHTRSLKWSRFVKHDLPTWTARPLCAHFKERLWLADSNSSSTVIHQPGSANHTVCDSPSVCPVEYQPAKRPSPVATAFRFLHSASAFRSCNCFVRLLHAVVSHICLMLFALASCVRLLALPVITPRSFPHLLPTFTCALASCISLPSLRLLPVRNASTGYPHSPLFSN